MKDNTSAALRKVPSCVTFAITFFLACFIFHGCAPRQKVELNQRERLRYQHEKQAAIKHFLNLTRKSIYELSNGKLIEGYIYNVAHLLESHDALDMPANDPLVTAAKKTLAALFNKHKRFPFDAFGCMPQAALSGLCHSGVDKSSEIIVKTTESWYALFETQWKREGWGECKTPGIQMTWGVVKGQNPFAKKMNCHAPAIEYTMKTFHAFARCGRHDLVEKAIAGYDAKSKIASLELKEHFWETDGLSWVIFAYLEDVAELEEAAKESDMRITDILSHLNDYPDIKDSPFLLTNMVRAHVLLNKKVDVISIQTLRHILTFGKHGVYPITTLRKFAGDYSDEYSASGSWGVALLIDAIEKYL